LHTAQVMPLPLTVSCFSKIQIGFTFLVLAHPGSPGQRAVKWVCVCVSLLSPVKVNTKHRPQPVSWHQLFFIHQQLHLWTTTCYPVALHPLGQVGPRPLIRQVRPGSAFRTMPVKLILRKIMKTVAIRCHILHLVCTKFDFGCGSAPDPTGGAYSWI